MRGIAVIARVDSAMSDFLILRKRRRPALRFLGTEMDKLALADDQ